MPLPPDHPLRRELQDEVHARPSETLHTPLRLSFLALAADPALREREWQHLRELAFRSGVELGPAPLSHVSADLGAFRLKMERHAEFTRYKFIVAGAGSDPFLDPALAVVPPDWVAGVPGALMVAAHAALLPAGEGAPDHEGLSARHFGGQMLVGAGLADGAGVALTDFRLHDGFSRLLVLDRGFTPRQAGRMLQRLLEIETYRMMALLALPAARELAPFLATSERELSEITTRLEDATEADEPMLLDRLTRLEAAIERSGGRTANRFTASAAYHELVKRRIVELREVRLPGLQTFQEFTERRLAPAMNTCQATSARQAALSERVARATQLLSTRVDVSREKQNLAVLASMDRRAEAQLRLQETVEGLSAAAITYYIVGLVGYAAKGAKVLGAPLNPEVVMALAIPVVLALVVFGVRYVRKLIS